MKTREVKFSPDHLQSWEVDRVDCESCDMWASMIVPSGLVSHTVFGGFIEVREFVAGHIQIKDYCMSCYLRMQGVTI